MLIEPSLKINRPFSLSWERVIFPDKASCQEYKIKTFQEQHVFTNAKPDRQEVPMPSRTQGRYPAIFDPWLRKSPSPKKGSSSVIRTCYHLRQVATHHS